MLRPSQLFVLLALALGALIGYVARSVPASFEGGDRGAIALEATSSSSPSTETPRNEARRLEAAPDPRRARQGAESLTGEARLARTRVSDADCRITGRAVNSSGAALENVRVTTDGRPVDAADALALVRSTEDVGRAMAAPVETDAEMAETLARHERAVREGRARACQAMSDGAGRFTLEVGAPGEYYLRASADGYDFRPQRVRTSAECELVGARVFEFELDLRLPSGEQPESSILATRERGGNSAGLRWSPATPIVRVPSPRLRFEAFAGDIRSTGRQGEYGSEFASGMVALDHTHGGRGPHRVTLVPRVTLTVTLEGGKDIGASTSAHVWALPATSPTNTTTTDRPSSSIALVLDRELYRAYGLAPGTWIVRAGWTYETALVERRVVVDGSVALTLGLPELGSDGQLQIVVLDPDGRRLPSVRFIERWNGPSGGGAGAVGAVRARDGSYWIPTRAIARGSLGVEGIEAHICARHDDYGMVLAELGRSPTQVELRFVPPCLLVAHVDGKLDGDLEVGAEPYVQALPEPFLWSMQQTAEPVDGRGVAYFPPLQPGRHALTMRAAIDTVRGQQGTKAVQVHEHHLPSGAHTVRFAAPAFHEVLISAPALAAGTRLALQHASRLGREDWTYEGTLDEGRRLALPRVLAGKYLLNCPNGEQEHLPVRVPSGAILYEPADRR